jgi:hypothetical protein
MLFDDVVLSLGTELITTLRETEELSVVRAGRRVKQGMTFANMFVRWGETQTSARG